MLTKLVSTLLTFQLSLSPTAKILLKHANLYMVKSLITSVSKVLLSGSKQ
jgi:hypothetical protein